MGRGHRHRSMRHRLGLRGGRAPHRPVFGGVLNEFAQRHPFNNYSSASLFRRPFHTEKQDRRLRLRIYVYEEQDNSVRIQVANMISDYLMAVGIQAPVISESFTSISSRLKAKNFDMAIAAFQMDVVPDPGFLLMSGNTGNYGSYKSKDMDKLFEKLRKTREFNAYQDILWQIQDQFAQDCPFVCMYYRSGALLTRKVFTVVRNVREPEILRGIESIGK